jgi:hypothetical protein
MANKQRLSATWFPPVKYATIKKKDVLVQYKRWKLSSGIVIKRESDKGRSRDQSKSIEKQQLKTERKH